MLNHFLKLPNLQLIRKLTSKKNPWSMTICHLIEEEFLIWMPKSMILLNQRENHLLKKDKDLRKIYGRNSLNFYKKDFMISFRKLETICLLKLKNKLKTTSQLNGLLLKTNWRLLKMEYSNIFKLLLRIDKFWLKLGKINSKDWLKESVRRHKFLKRNVERFWLEKLEVILDKKPFLLRKEKKERNILLSSKNKLSVFKKLLKNYKRRF